MDLEFGGQQIFNKIAWHALPIEVIASLHITDVTKGLSDEDVEVRRSILSASITPIPPIRLRPSGFYRIIHALSIAPSLQWINRFRKTLLRTLAIVQSLAVNRTAMNARMALRTLSQRPASVIRNGLLKKLPAKELVIGDIILVEAGDFVPADGRLFLAQSLSSFELSLNGDTSPVQKSIMTVAAETPLRIRSDMIYMGTQIATGRGRAIVVATGKDTEVGGRI